MANLFKPTVTKLDKTTGKRTKKKISLWWCKYRDADDIVRQKSLKVRDKAAANAMMNQLVREIEQEKAGIIDSGQKQLSIKINQNIQDHIDSYLNYLRLSSVSKKHLDCTTGRLNRIVIECRFRTLASIEPDRLRDWFSLQDKTNMSARTRNTYLSSIKAFIQWCIKENRLSRDPLLTLSKFNEKNDIRRQRRALNNDEIRRLLLTTETRTLNDMMIIRTGKTEEKDWLESVPILSLKPLNEAKNER